MGNHISSQQGSAGFIQMSNGSTSVLIDVLCLAGGELAGTEDEKAWMIWLAQHDQHLFGLGMVSFDIAEMPWQRERFDAQKAFLLRVLDAAVAKTGWEKLGYSPNEQLIFGILAQLRVLILAFGPGHLPESSEAEIYAFDGAVQEFDRCATHGAYLHCEGCVICNSAL